MTAGNTTVTAVLAVPIAGVPALVEHLATLLTREPIKPPFSISVHRPTPHLRSSHASYTTTSTTDDRSHRAYVLFGWSALVDHILIYTPTKPTGNELDGNCKCMSVPAGTGSQLLDWMPNLWEPARRVLVSSEVLSARDIHVNFLASDAWAADVRYVQITLPVASSSSGSGSSSSILTDFVSTHILPYAKGSPKEARARIVYEGSRGGAVQGYLDAMRAESIL
ncbi:hypothetical protein BC828DRAFT_380409 [Blastocladiella britannica]|nr:hypothetical protein BC828DRAFT_380409 [Blastocladiella britannica]